MAPFLTCMAIVFIFVVPSSSFIMAVKKYHAMPNATADASGTSQKTVGMFIMRFYVKVIQFVQCLGTNIRIFVAYCPSFGLFNKGKALRTWVWKAGRKGTTIHQDARNRTPFCPSLRPKALCLRRLTAQTSRCSAPFRRAIPTEAQGG